MKVPSIDTMALFLLIIGGLNAGVSAVFGHDFIGQALGDSLANTVVYALVGVSALYAFATRMGWIGSES